jgi:hypothetical protein
VRPTVRGGGPGRAPWRLACRRQAPRDADLAGRDVAVEPGRLGKCGEQQPRQPVAVFSHLSNPAPAHADRRKLRRDIDGVHGDQQKDNEPSDQERSPLFRATEFRPPAALARRHIPPACHTATCSGLPRGLAMTRFSGAAAIAGGADGPGRNWVLRMEKAPFCLTELCPWHSTRTDLRAGQSCPTDQSKAPLASGLRGRNLPRMPGGCPGRRQRELDGRD